MHYRPRSVIHTLDGGCLVSGLRYDASRTPQPVLESFLLKLDANGNFDPVSVEESISTTSLIRYYPNPSSNVLNFNFSLEEVYSISIFDVFGKEVMRRDHIKGNEKIDIKGLNNGLYFLKLTYNQKQYTGVFMKECD